MTYPDVAESILTLDNIRMMYFPRRDTVFAGQDDVDAANRESGGMEIMPIINVFNQYHAANTSKNIRAVLKANAKEGSASPGQILYGRIWYRGAERKFWTVVVLCGKQQPEKSELSREDDATKVPLCFL